MTLTGSPLVLAGGFFLAALVGVAGWKLQALTPGGALGATLIGGLVFGFGGPTWAMILITFFVASSLLSHLGDRHKARAIAAFEKAGPRDLLQTMANGGIAALMALIVGIVGHHSRLYPYCTLAYLGSLAAATADTWATEIGMLSNQRPRLITSWRPVQTGLSGGVTLLGLLGSLGGGLFLGVSAFLFIQAASLLTTGHWFLSDSFLLIILPIAGLIGSLTDSILGATLQRLYYCDQCQTPTEQKIHACGHSTRLIHGVAWMNNDSVNFLAACAGAIIAILAAQPFLSL